ISPPAGSYPSPLQVVVAPSSANPDPTAAFYRVGDQDSWHAASGPFWITNDVTVQYYAVHAPDGARSGLFSAHYSLGNHAAIPQHPQKVASNPNTVPANTNLVQLSPAGTLFYGRRSANDVGTIWAINLDGTADTYITSGARPRASRDGRYLAFLRGSNVF